ncbi:MAG: hypothetical protein AAF251_16640 [Pseudomonadota bacterium]
MAFDRITTFVQDRLETGVSFCSAAGPAINIAISAALYHAAVLGVALRRYPYDDSHRASDIMTDGSARIIGHQSFAKLLRVPDPGFRQGGDTVI